MYGVQFHNTPNKYTWQRPNDLISFNRCRLPASFGLSWILQQNHKRFHVEELRRTQRIPWWKRKGALASNGEEKNQLTETTNQQNISLRLQQTKLGMKSLPWHTRIKTYSLINTWILPWVVKNCDIYCKRFVVFRKKICAHAVSANIAE